MWCYRLVADVSVQFYITLFIFICLPVNYVKSVQLLLNAGKTKSTRYFGLVYCIFKRSHSQDHNDQIVSFVINIE